MSPHELSDGHERVVGRRENSTRRSCASTTRPARRAACISFVG
jgi:hypothetical protein